jgi:parallel beta-helix repeat protein
MKHIIPTIFITLFFFIPASAEWIVHDNKTTTFSPSPFYTTERRVKSNTPKYIGHNGHITSNMTWDQDVIINGDVWIDDGVTLTINAGVTVSFLKIDQNQDGIGDIDFFIDGILQSNGTYENPVVFCSFEENPMPKDWGGIDFLNVDENEISNMTYTNIQHCNEGLMIQGIALHYNGGTVSTCGNIGIKMLEEASATFSNLEIINNHQGFSLQNATAQISNIQILDNTNFGLQINNSSPVLKDCNIADNGSDGIKITESSGIFDNCQIFNNENFGVFIENASPEITNCIISNNTFSGIKITGENADPNVESCSIVNNQEYGVIFDNCKTDEISTTFSNCEISFNEKSGIVINNASSKFINCIFSGNEWSGVKVNHSSSNPMFEKCMISRNKNHGFYFENASKGNVSNCTIIQNEDNGIKITGNSQPVFTHNNIYNNVGNDDSDVESYIYTKYFNSSDWKIYGVSSKSHPVSSFQPMKMIEIKCYLDGDKEYVKREYYRNCCKVVIKEYTADSACFSLYGNYEYIDMGSNYYYLNITKRVLNASDIAFSIYSTNNCPNARGWVSQYTYKCVTPTGYQVSVFNDDAYMANFQNNWWDQFSGVDTLIFQNEPGNTSYEGISLSPHNSTEQSFFVTNNVKQVPSSAGIVSFQTTTNADFLTCTAISSATWLKNYPSEFKAGQPFNVTYEKNLGDSRNGTITLIPNHSNKIPQTIKIYQDAFYHLTLPDTRFFPVETASIPLSLNNPSEQSIEGIDVTIEFDGSILEPVDVSLAGGILENQTCDFEINTSNENQLMLSIAITSEPFTKSGAIAFLQFNIKGNGGDNTNLTFTEAHIDEKSVLAKNGKFTVSNSISGYVGYFNKTDTLPVKNVRLLVENQPYSATTTEQGKYTLNDLPAATYVITPSKKDDTAGLSATDASRILKKAVNNYDLNCYEQIAADVTRNGSIEAPDAARVAKYVAHQAVNDVFWLNNDHIDWTFISRTISSCSDWPPIEYSSSGTVNNSNTDLNFIGIRLGDVNASWSPDTRKNRLSNITDGNIPEIKVRRGDTLSIPVSIDQNQNIEGIDITISFDESIIDAMGASMENSILKGFHYEEVLTVDNKASLVIYGSEIISSKGQIAQLKFKGKKISSTLLSLNQFDCNDSPATGGFNVNNTFSKRVKVTVSDNTPPTISAISNQKTNENTPTLPIAFEIHDINSPASQLSVNAYASNKELIPESQIIIKGTENNRTIQITPATNQSGVSMITITVDDGADNVSTSFEIEVTPYNGQVLIVAGGGMENNTLWNTTEYLANKFYRTMHKRHYAHEHIMYLSDHSFHYDFDGDNSYEIIVDDHEPLVTDIQLYLESLYTNDQPPAINEHNPLIIYFSDHGANGQLKINTKEYLKASDLDLWLDTLQEITHCQVVLIVEACHSGSIIKLLSPENNQQRILVSSSETEDSWTDQEGLLSFSQFFISYVDEGESVLSCFKKTIGKMETHHIFAYQRPQLIGQVFAETFHIAGTAITSDIVPEIISTTADQTVHAGQCEIFAHVTDLEGIEKVWASIMPPGYILPKTDEPFESPLLELDRIDLEDVNKDNIYKNNYHFKQNGIYVITIFAKDIWDNVATHEIELTVTNGIDLSDINNDHIIDVSDVVLALQIISGMGTDQLSGLQKIGLKEAIMALCLIAEEKN